MTNPITQPYTVYALVDPRDQVVWYVGISKHVQRRYQEHCGGRTSRLLASWCEELRGQELLPLLRILEEGIPGERAAESREWHWTKVFLTAGAPLLNNISDSVREKDTQGGTEHMTGLTKEEAVSKYSLRYCPTGWWIIPPSLLAA